MIPVSYSRFDTSDVHVFLHADRYYDCAGCLLQDRHWVPDPATPLGGSLKIRGREVQTSFISTRDVLAHLDEHRTNGHVVLDETYEALIRDQVANDAWINRTSAP